jgi:hypothetical protein
MTALANKIDDGPVFLSLLQVFDTQTGSLVPPQSASQEKSQQGNHHVCLSCVHGQDSATTSEPVHPSASFPFAHRSFSGPSRAEFLRPNRN